MQADKILAEGKNNPKISKDLIKACSKAMFESSRTYGLFTAYFDEELYRYAANFYDTHAFGYDRPIHSILGVTRVLEDVEISQRNRSPYDSMKHFLEKDFAIIHNNEPPKPEIQIPDKFKSFLTARIDIKLMSTAGDFQIVSISDKKVNVTKPAWFQKGGIGYMIHSYAGTLEIIAKPTVEGKITLYLRGIDVRDTANKSKFIPYWIDYTKLIVKDKTLFDTITPIWHNKPYKYTMNVKANEEVKIQVEWQPHRSDT